MYKKNNKKINGNYSKTPVQKFSSKYPDDTYS